MDRGRGLDYLAAVRTETRNACTAGYKGIFQDGHYPSCDFLAALDPRFAGFADDKLAHPISPLGARPG